MPPEQHGWFITPGTGPFYLSFDLPKDFIPSEDRKLSIPRYREALCLLHALHVRHGVVGHAVVTLHRKTVNGKDRVVKTLAWLDRFHAERYRKVLEFIEYEGVDNLPKALHKKCFIVGDDELSVHGLLHRPLQSETDITTLRNMERHSFADRVLSCVPITNRVGVSIWEETSLVQIFDALVEIVERE
jgi:hypothetical protein